MTDFNLRKGIWEQSDVRALARDMGDFARDVAAHFGRTSSSGFTKKKLDAVYTEPFYLSSDSEPDGLIAVRIRKLTALETPILTGGVCHFTYDAAHKRCRINSIDGMTPEPGVLYRFTFLMVG